MTQAVLDQGSAWIRLCTLIYLKDHFVALSKRSFTRTRW
jgi:hypothetical protein